MKTLLIAAVCLTSLMFAAHGAPDGGAKGHAENIDEVLANYGKLTGKKVLFDNTVQGQIALADSSDDSANRKIELIEKTLFLDGFKVVDVGDDMIAVVGLGKPVRSVGLPLYTKPEELPTGQRVFSYLFKLEHSEPQEVAGFLTQYIPPDAATSFTPNRSSGTLIATGQTSVIRTVIKIVAALDAAADPSAKPSLRP